MTRTVISSRQAAHFIFERMVRGVRRDSLLAEVALAYVLCRVAQYHGPLPHVDQLDWRAYQTLLLALDSEFRCAVCELNAFYEDSAMFLSAEMYDPEWQEACEQTRCWLKNFQRC